MKSQTVQPLSNLMLKHRFWSFLLAALLLCACLPAYAADVPGDDFPPPIPEEPDDSEDPDSQDGDPFYVHSGEFTFAHTYLTQASNLRLVFKPKYSTLFDFHGPLG